MKTNVATATQTGVWVNGKFQKYGNFPKKVENSVFLNGNQRNLYRKIMYGFREFSQEEFQKLSSREKNKISQDYIKGKRILHNMKCKKFYNAENTLLNGIFSHVKIGTNDYQNVILPRSATLNKLGIDTKTIIDEFIKQNILPSDFYNL